MENCKTPERDVQKLYPSVIKKITPVTEYIIVTEALNHPGIMLHKLQVELVQQTGVAVCLSTICRFLHRIGFTRQKMNVTAIQRDDFL